MYTFIKAVCLARSTGSQWGEKDLSNILVYDIFNTYTEVFLVLSSIYYEGPLYVNMATLKEEFSSFNGTLTQMLDKLGNRTLTIAPKLPNAKVRYAKFSDAYLAGYKVDRTLMNVATTQGYPTDALTDLKITRAGYDTDMKLLHNHCLITVNGYLHQTDADSTAAYVKDGGLSNQIARQNALGILSFLDIGKVTKVAIKEGDIYPQNSEAKLRERLYFRTDADIENKTVLLSLGGYLVMPEENVFWQSGSHSFALNVEALPIVERILESKHFIDLSPLGIDTLPNDEYVMDLNQILGDDVLKKYLTLSQSFLIIIDTPSIFTNRVQLRSSSWPGVLTAYHNPVDPLIVGYGRMAEYWKEVEDGQWTLTINNGYRDNYLFRYRAAKQQSTVSDAKRPAMLSTNAKGMLLQIGSYA